jgi:hypothetical protein
VEQRPHLLELDVEELELHPDAPDLAPKWYQSLTFYVSFHPRPETNPEAIPLPRDPPVQSQDGSHVVSASLVARVPAVKLAQRLSGFLGREEEEAKKPSGNPVVEYKEHLELVMPQLDRNLVAYVWANKSSIGGSEMTLIGRSLAPMHDFALQRRLTTWGVFDVMEGHRVAELRVKYAVITSPGKVLRPQLQEVKREEVTIKWTASENDHGAPTTAYQISILLNEPNSGPKWHILCPQTRTTNPVYVVTNLNGNTSYMLDIRAINKVGVGDPCEFEIQTSPVEPEPPARPYIQEARDGCLNVAWGPSIQNGGAAITCYKVKMRKIMGASKWNPFGPGEATATWVDMGTIGAAANDQDAPSTYDAWVGPLEPQSCEYRFQIVALTHVGTSKGSELSEAYYT